MLSRHNLTYLVSPLHWFYLLLGFCRLCHMDIFYHELVKFYWQDDVGQVDVEPFFRPCRLLSGPPVWPDWVIFSSSWQQIVIFLIMSLLCGWLLFWQILGKIRQLFIQSSGHTVLPPSRYWMTLLLPDTRKSMVACSEKQILKQSIVITLFIFLQVPFLLAFASEWAYLSWWHIIRLCINAFPNRS